LAGCLLGINSSEIHQKFILCLKATNRGVFLSSMYLPLFSEIGIDIWEWNQILKSNRKPQNAHKNEPDIRVARVVPSAFHLPGDKCFCPREQRAGGAEHVLCPR
jgi:hypothetical protein